MPSGPDRTAGGTPPAPERRGLHARSPGSSPPSIVRGASAYASPKRQREIALRASLADARTIVVKVGSSSLTTNGRLSDEKIARIARQVLAVASRGRRVILVSSGAIVSGTTQLRLEKRPRTLPVKQAMAAVGNVLLMERYQRFFQAHSQPVGLVLLTRYDVSDRRHFLNARNTLNALLDLGVIPIVNENDTVATDEIKFGDNDNLSAAVATLVDADLLVILTDVGGLHPVDPRVYPESRAISFIETIDESVLAMAGGSHRGVGGMTTKIEAARIATQGGCAVVLTDAAAPDALDRILAGERLGTLFAPQGPRMGGRKRWLAAGFQSKGRVFLDQGACRALLEQGRSLLPVGVTGVEGVFEAGEVVTLVDPSGTPIGSGLTNYSSAQIEMIRGKHTNELRPAYDFDEVVHRNNMVLWRD